MTKNKKNDIGCPSIAKFRLDELVAAEYNPRTISDEAMEGLGNSIRKFGCVEPIVVNVRGGKNVIVGGHQRFRALQAMGEVVDLMCVTVDCSKADEKLLNLTLNNQQIQGRFIKEIGEYIEKLRTSIPDSVAVDLRITELQEELGGPTENKGNVPDDQVPEPPKKPKTKLGDLYLLGEHRLLCGDATKAEDVERVMGGKKADMVFTDPPYGVNVKGGNNKKNVMAGDLTQVAIPFSFDLAVTIATTTNARLYFCGSERNLALYEKLFDRFLNQQPRHLIWVKNGFVMKANGYHNQYELIYYGYKPKGGGLNCWFAGRTEEEASDVWRISRDVTISNHPTQKPVELVERATRNSTQENVVIYDPFLGSGTTIIAAEKLNRKCYGLEIDPVYCDVIVKRWEEWTGGKAKLEKEKGKKENE